MNKATVPSQRNFAFATDRPAEEETIDVQKIFLMARRQMKSILGCSALGIVLAFVFMYLSPPVYSSSSQILVDQNIGKVVGDVSTLPATIQTDAEILSNIEVLKSMRLALAVVDAENLADDPAFLNSPPSVARQLLQPARDGVRILRETAKSILEGNESETGPRVTAAKDKRETAAERLRSDLGAERVGRSFVINTTYQSHDPERAHRLLEATVRAFLVDQQLANIAASQVATNWMKVRLDELADQSHEAGLAVERFRADNGLSIARGELVSEQRLSELNGQLVLAQSELGQAEARARQMDAIISGGIEAATLNAVSAGATTQDAAVAALRTRYSGLSRRIESITARWGEDHAQAQSLRGERDNVARELYAELQRIAAQYQSELSVAQNRVQALRDQTNAQTGSNASSNQLLVQLSGLEQKAESLKALYGSSLTRYEEALQRQSFPVSNLRVISPATQPQAPSEPRLVPTLAMFLLLGGLLGCGVGAMREFNDRYFRVGEDVRRLLGVRFLGYLPRLKGFGGGGKDRIMHVSLDRPNSSFTETLRKIRLNLNPEVAGASSRVIGVISILPGEGKTTVAANLAGFLATTGARTILIDADLRRPRVSQVLAPRLPSGLVDAARGQPWGDAVKVDERTGLVVMPNASASEGPHDVSVLSSTGMERLLGELRAAFDYVVLDLPPIGPVADAASMQPLIDSFVLVLQWGSTPIELTCGIFQSEQGISHKIVGAVLNKTNISALRRYGATGSDTRAYRRYRSYYNEVA